MKARGLCYSHFGWILVKSGAPRCWPSPLLPTRPGAFVISPEETELARKCKVVVRLSSRPGRPAEQ